MKQTILTIGFIMLFFAAFAQNEIACCNGKCVGSAGCTACKTCEYCKHCNSGGSCGVCSRGSYGSSNSYGNSSSSGNNSSSSNNSNNTTSNNKSAVNVSKGSTVYVNATQLNLRSCESFNCAVVEVLSKDTKLEVLDKSNNIEWLKVKVVSSGKIGYVSVFYVR